MELSQCRGVVKVQFLEGDHCKVIIVECEVSFVLIQQGAKERELVEHCKLNHLCKCFDFQLMNSNLACFLQQRVDC